MPLFHGENVKEFGGQILELPQSTTSDPNCVPPSCKMQWSNPKTLPDISCHQVQASVQEPVSTALPGMARMPWVQFLGYSFSRVILFYLSYLWTKKDNYLSSTPRIQRWDRGPLKAAINILQAPWWESSSIQCFLTALPSELWFHFLFNLPFLWNVTCISPE